MKAPLFVRTTLLLVLNIVGAVAMVGFGPPKLVDREVQPTIRLSTDELREWFVASQPPELTSDALLVYDVDADRILYSRNADQAYPPASLTKLMTALLVLESDSLSELVEIEAEDLVGGATMGLVDGENVTIRELLWGLLVPSGNDAAMAIARSIGGNVDGFVELMNQRAAELDLTSTQFKNPHGFDADEHVMSARDLLALSLRLMEYPLFQEIVQAEEVSVAGRLLQNTNEFLGFYPGVTGIKTGTTPLAGQCLVTLIDMDGRRLLIVVLGSSDRYSDVAGLHKLYTDNYEWVTTDFDDLSVMNRLYATDGRVVPITVEEGAFSNLRHRWGDPDILLHRSIVLDEPVGETDELTSRSGRRVVAADSTLSADDVVGQLAPAQKVGTAAWLFGDKLLAEQELTVR